MNQSRGYRPPWRPWVGTRRPEIGFTVEDPFGGLAGDGGDQLEVGVVVQYGEVTGPSDRGDESVDQ